MELTLLLGKPVSTTVGKIHPLTLNEINEMGEDKYNKYLSLLTFHVGDLDVDIDTSEMTTFDFIVLYCLHDLDHRKLTEEALSLFFRECVEFRENYCAFLVNKSYERAIYRDNYEEVKMVLIKQNCLRDKQEFNPEDGKTKDFIRKLKQMRSKYRKALQKDSSTLVDVVSAVCAKHNTISPLNVGELTIYAIFDQFKRLNAIDNYFLNFEAILQGAKKQDGELRHWSAPILN